MYLSRLSRLLVILLFSPLAWSQTAPTPAPAITSAQPANAAAKPEPCSNAPLQTSSLLGQWLVQWTGDAVGEPADARLAFAVNPEFADSLLGLLNLGTQKHEIAGDIEEELLTLEQSPDGKSISANWSLRATPGRCGRELTGTWIRAADGLQRQVVLRRPAKW